MNYELSRLSCAKINLGLNVVSKRPDGYHNLETVFYPVPVKDKLTVTVRNNDSQADDVPYHLTVLDPQGNELFLCPPEKNLIVKAYLLLAKNHTMPPIDIVLEKNVPSQAGMGGGSSDAAFMIRLLNEQFSLGLTTEQMQQYAAQLGADCAFFITADSDNPAPVYATGIGDVLTPVNSAQYHWNALKGKWIALVKPDVAVSTAVAYSHITPRQPQKNCLDVIKQPIETWREDLVNDFEEAIFPLLPELAAVKADLYAHGAVYAAMSGSGSTIFGIFNQEPTFIPQQYGSIYNTYYQITQ